MSSWHGDLTGVRLAICFHEIAQDLATKGMAEVAGAHHWESTPLGLTAIRNLHDPVHVFRLLHTGRGELHLDPICHIRVDARSALRLGHRDEPPYFCSTESRDRFAQSGRTP